MKQLIKNDKFLGVRIKTCWVIALRPEANPVIEAFDMGLISNELLFPIYMNLDNGHALVISGVGPVKSAAGTTYLKSFLNVERYAAWINFGIAGYYKEPTGELYQAIKVENYDNGKAFFPGLRFAKHVPGAPLLSVSKPAKIFRAKALYDMEAAGFCELAPSFSCNELTYVFKVVSDTPNTCASLLTNKMVTGQIEKNIGKISKIMDLIGDLVKDEQKRIIEPEEFQEFLSNYYFTENNRRQFWLVYRKWKSAFPDRTLNELHYTPTSARELITNLKKELIEEAKDWKLV